MPKTIQNARLCQEWAIRNPKKVMLNAAKRRAFSKGIPFEVTVDDFEIPEFCPVLGLRLERNTNSENGVASDNSPSLDRIKPRLGYVTSNVRVICWRANKLKSDATLEELVLILQDAKRTTP